ncbi:TPA: hypothetical protein ACWV5Q_005146 [Salmonella enterica subsp. enterica serovar Muenchen]
MTTITRERAQEIFLGNGPEPTASEQRELARIALASLTAKPIAHTSQYGIDRMIRDNAGLLVQAHGGNAYEIPLYTTPPAPIVPDAISTRQAISKMEECEPCDSINVAYKYGWNACRATMLQAEPVTTANKLGNSQVHSDCCQEQSPIDHGYRPECECSGCKATARICAELTGNSPVIPEGLVKAVHFYEQAKRENPPIETGVWKDAIDWVLKEACLAASTLESSREHEVISQQEKA